MLPEKKVTIAVFDFDNTLIRKNTLFDFFYYNFPIDKFIFSLIYLFPFVLKYLLKIITNSDLKEKFLIFYLRGMPINQFGKLCLIYKERLNKITNTKLMKRLLWHKDQGHKIIIVSASPENWILPWAQTYNIEVVATQLENKGEILTGYLLGQNCYGPEKVIKLLNKYPNRSEYNLYVYGDGASDKDLLKIADHPYKETF